MTSSHSKSSESGLSKLSGDRGGEVGVGGSVSEDEVCDRARRPKGKRDCRTIPAHRT